jgi:hypothetical protein
MKSAIFWNIMPWNPVEVHGYFGVTYCFHLQGRWISEAASKKQVTKRAMNLTSSLSQAATLLIYIREVSGSNLVGGPAILAELLHRFPQFVYANAGTEPNLSLNWFPPLPSYLLFIIVAVLTAIRPGLRSAVLRRPPIIIQFNSCFFTCKLNRPEAN